MAANLVELLKAQATEIDELNRLIRNYNKDGQERKTQRYLKDKLCTFDEMFNTISHNNDKILTNINPDQPYILEKTFDQIKEKYVTARQDIVARLDTANTSGIPNNVPLVISSVHPTVPSQGNGNGITTESNGSSVRETDAPNATNPSIENNAIGTSNTPNLSNDNNSSDEKNGTSSSNDLLQVQYEDLMDIIANARDINASSSMGTVRVHMELLNGMWSELRKLVYEYKTNGKSIAFNYNTLTSKYMDVSSKLNDFLQRSSSSRVEATHSNAQFSLPKIELPKFSGKTNEWQGFIALFDRMIHHNEKIDKGMKVEYLKSCVKDSAAKIINHLDPTPENYDTCYALLRKRFDNKRELVNGMLNNVIDLPKLKSENAESLKTMHDTVYESLMAIKNLGVSKDQLFDHLISHILIKKLDSSTLIHYECQLNDVKDLSKIESFLSYIENRFMALQSVGVKGNLNFEKYEKSNNNNAKAKCVMCNGDHGLYKCPLFLKKLPRERSDFIKEKKMCTNCFAPSHRSRECTSKFVCKSCGKPHHTLLHFETKKFDDKTTFKANVAKVQRSPSQTETIHVQSTVALQKTGAVLLATAMIAIPDKNGTMIMLRALLDQGSQAAFITENAAQTLGLSRQSINAIVSGIGASEQRSNHMIKINIYPRFESDFVISSEAIVLKKLTQITHFDYNESDFDFTNNLTLADPSFLRESDIDIILGASEYAQAIKSGLIKTEKNLIAQNTEFGWIVTGALMRSTALMRITALVTNIELEQQLNRFFSSDDFINVDGESLTEEEEMCEKHFAATHTRNEQGRFVVTLPLKTAFKEPNLGDSRRAALASLFSMERRFSNKPEIRNQYSDFIREYLDSAHMSRAIGDHPNAHYLPHHCVFKDSTTTKLRVVFNASQKTSNKLCLNEQLAIGPTDQTDLPSILLRWRRHRIAFAADIEKMYRQILLNDNQRHLQRILWRENESETIREYQLNTLTYGMASAPYLAIRVLKQLAKDGTDQYPIGAKTLESDFYVDDVLSGADSIEEASNLYKQLTELMYSGGFHLRKYSSNSHDFLNNIPLDDQELNSNNGIIKTLGVVWLTNTDELSFNVPDTPTTLNMPMTKRQLASEVATLYDPLGYIGPVVIVGKQILQKLWHHKIEWDDKIPQTFVDEWQKIKSELNLIADIKIPRWLEYSPNDIIELHGFCDASEVGYAAALYIANISRRTSHLLVAKARVSPIKEEQNSDNVTIPRLELCGALLLAQMTQKTLKVMEINFNRIRLWSDSRIVLDWIHANPRRYKTFIASRISKINKCVNASLWSHVPTEQNAADCASRGITPSQLINHSLWWNGPRFLIEKSLEPPSYIPPPEIEVHGGVGCVTEKQTHDPVLPNASSFRKLKRVVAFCFRFAYNCKNKAKRTKALTHDELQIAETAIVKVVQSECFQSEIESLKKKNVINKSSSLRNLSPFLDKNGLLRVGGRLKNADVPYNMKHQFLLPSKHFVSELIIKETHLNCMHGGPKLTESILRQNFWITNSQRSIKSVIGKCKNCFKVAPKLMCQYMADLPPVRVNTVDKAFTNTAVDYTGAIHIKITNGRGYKTKKAYIAIFVCMTTKAIHVEVVSDMTAVAFIAAYRRFVSRRGTVKNLYSDNGTNFVRSNKILMENMQDIDDHYDDAICQELLKTGTRWHFTPPGAPHMNGLAEAAVKSVKLHLKRTIGESKLTFEELSTLLAQVEACVNSRPLCALSSDPNDISALTPAHFLIGEPLISPPEQNHLEEKTSWLTRWQRVQQMCQYFWKRWQSDYLNQLQVRSKWHKKGNAPEINDLVLIRDENLPTSQWQTGRVIDTHPGSDGLTRVVSLKTNNGVMKRPIVKLCAFPKQEDEASDVKTTVAANIARVHRSKPRHGWNVLPILTAMLAVFTTLSHQSPLPAEPFAITKFNSSPGFYFEKSQDVFMSYTNWNILVHLDIRKFHTEFDHIKGNLTVAKQFCYRKAPVNSGCRNIVTHLYSKMEILETRNSLIFESNRSKRSIPTLHIVGDVLSDLFGTLGSKFESNYVSDMALLHKNEKHLLALLKNHTSLFDSTFNFIKQNEMDLKSHIETIGGYINSISNETSKLEIESNVQSILSYLSAMISDYEQRQNAIFDTITDSRRNHINHDLLTPKQIEAQRETIAKQVGTEFRVPSGIEFYSVGKIAVFRLQNQYVFKISIPLLQIQNFKLFKIIPVPTLRDNKFYWIRTDHKFLITSNDRQSFQYMNDMAHCISYNNNKALICNKPMHWFTSSKLDCVWNIFNHIPNRECSMSEGKGETYFESLKNNMFLFVIPNSLKINVICKDRVTHGSLSGEGILSLQSDCILGSETIKLVTKKYFDSEAELIVPHLESFNLTEIMPKQNEVVMTNETHMKLLEITQLQSKLNETTENLHLFKSNSIYHNVHHYSVYYFLVIIVIILFWYMNRKSAESTLRPAPVPMPRLSLAGPENVDDATNNA